MLELHAHVDVAGLPTGTPGGEPVPSRVCMIDLGTNSFHALLVDVFSNGTFAVIDKIKEAVRLGEGLVEHRLSEAALRRGLAALRRVRLLADGRGATEFLAFATSAIREAENGGVFLERVRRETGIDVRVISGEQEARLIYRGVRHVVDLPEPALLVDIGGGSTEFIVGTREEALYLTSLKIGAARMTEQFVSTDPISDREFRALRAHYRTLLAPVYEAVRRHGVRRLVGSSGTMENLAQVAAQAAGTGNVSVFQQGFEGSVLRQIARRLIRADRAGRAEIEGIDRKRVDQVVAGAVLVDVLLKDLPLDRVAISPAALRDGMMLYYAERNAKRIRRLSPFGSVRRRSVYELAFRFRWEEAHGRHVAALALELFDATQPVHGRGKADRELLEYAALLHDIGYVISRRGHHAHTYYLIKQADLYGFTPEEIEIVAGVARYHSGAGPKKSHAGYRRLSPEHQRLVGELAALLRLANGLDRSHFQNVTDLDLRLDEERLRILIRARADPQLEIWSASQSRGLFEKTFGRRVEVVADGRTPPAPADTPP